MLSFGQPTTSVLPLAATSVPKYCLSFGPGACRVCPSETPRRTPGRGVGVSGGSVSVGGRRASPQARGRPVDEQADIWAFGVLFYEMLTGRKAFEGSDVSATLARVIERDPVWEAIPASLCPQVAAFLRSSLVKDQHHRLHDIGDMRLALEGAFDSAPPGPAGGSRTGYPRTWFPWVVAAALVVGTIPTTLFFSGQRGEVVRPVARTTLGISADAVDLGRQVWDVDISADGSRVVYVRAEASGDIYLRRLDTLAAERLTSATAGAFPAFSPDGRWVAFVDGSSLRLVPADGGESTVLAALPSGGYLMGLTWIDADTIVVGSQDGGLRQVDLDGDSFELVPGDDGAVLRGFPFSIPGRNAVLFNEGLSQVFNASEGPLAALDLETGDTVPLGVVGSRPRYVSTGHLLYGSASGTLYAAPFDATRLRLTGPPVAMVNNVLEGTGRSAAYGVSDGGLLVYAAGTAASRARIPVWVDRQGKVESTSLPPREYLYLRRAPGGSDVLFTILGQSGRHIQMWNRARGELIPVAPDMPNGTAGIWSHDRRRVIFSTLLPTGQDIFWQLADGSGAPERLLTTSGAGAIFPSSVTPSGTGVVVWAPLSGLSYHTLTGERTPLVEGSARNGEVSPDGRWLAYEEEVGGQYEIYVRPFPTGEGAVPVTGSSGGTTPAWRSDGRELFYVSNDERLMGVTVEPGPPLSVGPRVVLVDGDYYFGGNLRNYDVDASDSRFLLLQPIADGRREAPRVVAVFNWFEELTARVPLP